MQITKIRSSFFVLIALFFVLPAGAGRTALDSLNTAELQSDWVLESAVCNDGTPAELNYTWAYMNISYYGTITANFQHESCGIELEGSWSSEPESGVIMTEFTSGSWTTCGNALPSYVLNRFGYSQDAGKLVLESNDLSPFASCKGKAGKLIFKNEG